MYKNPLKYTEKYKSEQKRNKELLSQVSEQQKTIEELTSLQEQNASKIEKLEQLAIKFEEENSSLNQVKTHNIQIFVCFFFSFRKL